MRRVVALLVLAAGCGGGQSSVKKEDPASQPAVAVPIAALGDDDKHRLYQAAGMTGDEAIVQRMMKAIGLRDAGGAPSADAEAFAEAHGRWSEQHVDFVLDMNDRAKARAYVEAHLPPAR
jgi:hypothetical protein